MRRRTVLVVLVILGILVLLNLPLGLSRRLKAGSADNMAPFQNAVSLLVNRVRSVTSYVAGARQAVREKEDRLREIAMLRHEVARRKALEQDNVALRELLGFKKTQPHDLVLTEVVARGDTTGWWQTVRLNRGQEEGIAPDMAVMTIDALIGRITAVSRHTCDVLLITDPSCRVACKIERTQATGILLGTGVTFTGGRAPEMLYAMQPLQMDYLSKEEAVLPGDEIVTSGLGGVYPENIPVGRVTETRLDASGLYQRAVVQPGAALDKLKYVFVVKEEPPR